MRTVCRNCAAETTFPAYRLRKSDYRCNDCVAADLVAYRLRRIADGRPVTRRAGAVRSAAVDAKAFQRSYADPVKRARHKARAWVRTQIARGQMRRGPCEVCGSTPSEAHHDDYSKPLDVRWLCPTHHREHHTAKRRALREAGQPLFRRSSITREEADALVARIGEKSSTHCKRGHPRTEANRFRKGDCRACVLARNAAWAKRNRVRDRSSRTQPAPTPA